jgi:hypothetical protein
MPEKPHECLILIRTFNPLVVSSNLAGPTKEFKDLGLRLSPFFVLGVSQVFTSQVG